MKKIFSKIISCILVLEIMMSSLVTCIAAYDFSIQYDETTVDNVLKKFGAEKGQVVIIKNGEIKYTANLNCNENEEFYTFAMSRTILGIVAMAMQEDGYVDIENDTVVDIWKRIPDKDSVECSENWKKYYGSTVGHLDSQNFAKNKANLTNLLTNSAGYGDVSMSPGVDHVSGGISYKLWNGGSIANSYSVGAFLLAHAGHERSFRCFICTGV